MEVILLLGFRAMRQRPAMTDIFRFVFHAILAAGGFGHSPQSLQENHFVE
jgi:hypothetical protein